MPSTSSPPLPEAFKETFPIPDPHSAIWLFQKLPNFLSIQTAKGKFERLDKYNITWLLFQPDLSKCPQQVSCPFQRPSKGPFPYRTHSLPDEYFRIHLIHPKISIRPLIVTRIIYYIIIILFSKIEGDGSFCTAGSIFSLSRHLFGFKTQLISFNFEQREGIDEIGQPFLKVASLY